MALRREEEEGGRDGELGHNFPVLSLNSHSRSRRMLQLQARWNRAYLTAPVSCD